MLITTWFIDFAIWKCRKEAVPIIVGRLDAERGIVRTTADIHPLSLKITLQGSSDAIERGGMCLNIRVYPVMDLLRL